MSLRKISIAAAVTAAAGALVFGGATLASADTGTAAPSASSTAGGYGPGGQGGSADTAVTGDELAKVTAAMKAKDATVTVTGVRKDPDGSYDVLGTKNGTNVMYDVSADLKTFTERAGGHGGHGGPGGSADTPVTGDELAKVTAAMKAEDATVTVTGVQKDPDGSYDVLGTKNGTNVAYDVSADLKTFTERAGRPAAPSSSGTTTN